MAVSNNERRIPHLRDVFGFKNSEFPKSYNENTSPNATSSNQEERYKEYEQENNLNSDKGGTKDKYKTLERHLSMKKTIRRKMMRDLRYIGVDNGVEDSNGPQDGFLDKLRTDQPPSANIEKPSLWRRLTKGWPGGKS